MEVRPSIVVSNAGPAATVALCGREHFDDGYLARLDRDLKATANVIVCTIRDDGRGIAWLDDSRPIGMGILGMKERAAALGGTLTIRNRPRGGTAVTASFSKEATEWRLKPEPSGS